MSVYLDYNATTPIDPRVLDEMIGVYKNNPGNADSRTHDYGENARVITETARKKVAALLGVASNEIIFTSGATESNNIAIQGLKEYAENFYSDDEFEEKRKKYTHAQPFTKESLLYREIFEKYYEGNSEMIVDFWMPNKKWEGCNVNDPSARVLSNYGESGK